ncbi:unnamed protein product [Prorocentrum cordatum]|uniref:Cellulase n=1 Tax=Prorocentrum cordatum TaxID=2364126 RepID=A0ABN9XAQ4_9DINO|nr:unnamed protein product [Polarella glacialis]
MAAARTMQVGLLLAILGSARATCLKPGYDMGDSANSCGYAPEVKVFGGPGYDFSAHSWIASKGITTEAVGAAEDLDSATDCQALCLGAGADYFAYDPVALCVCKAEYAEASCYPLYAPYESSSAMIAGPASCGTCFRVDHDMGADFNGCGYAPEVKVFGGPGYDFSAHSWIASKGITTEAVGAAEDLDSATDCQALCLGAGADYFAYDPVALCVCKAEYAEASCYPLYAPYESSSAMIAGPASCGTCFRVDHDMGADFNGRRSGGRARLCHGLPGPLPRRRGRLFRLRAWPALCLQGEMGTRMRAASLRTEFWRPGHHVGPDAVSWMHHGRARRWWLGKCLRLRSRGENRCNNRL